MVGWHLLLLLIVEVVAYGAIGRRMHVAHGWSVGQAVALAIAIYVGVRAVLVAAEFIVARSVGSTIPAPLRVSWARALAMYVRELAGWILMFTFVMPYVTARRSVVRGEPASASSTRTAPPILLVHGLACNRGNWFWFKRRLRAQGYRVYTMDCTPPVSPIARYGDQVRDAVDEIIDATGASQLVLIGHSQGGVTIRAYLDRHGDARVAKVITLGSPHRGTFLARLAIGPNAVDMREGSEWLSGVTSRERERARLPYTRFSCVFTYHDNLVSPQENALLPGAKAIALSGIGHLSLALSPTVLRHVVSELESLGQQTFP
jgi:pimeloyl-ACP methyl ester carboxylesterase